MIRTLVGVFAVVRVPVLINPVFGDVVSVTV